MGFKIKKSILAGTSGHRKAVTDRNASLIKINRSIDKSSRDDGRAKSSALQLTTDEKRKMLSEKINMNEPTVDVTTVDNDQGGVDTTTTTTNTGDNTKVFEKEQVSDFRKNCYVNGVFQKGKTINGQLCEHAKPGEEPKETDTEITPISDVDVKKESTEKEPEPEKKESSCYCINKSNGSEVDMPCPNKPGFNEGHRRQLSYPQNGTKNVDACNPKKTPNKYCNGMTNEEVSRERKKCKSMGNMLSRTAKQYKWSNTECKCVPGSGTIIGSGKKVIEGIKDIDLSKCIPKLSKKGKIIGCQEGGGMGTKTALGNFRKGR
tara:strand:+ start:741 stop:1697 length:957 start_codon:yes stop_codon:yes gene_type:complete